VPSRSRVSPAGRRSHEASRLRLAAAALAWVAVANRRPFDLHDEDHGYCECNFKLEGYRVLFTQGGQAMQAMVALGRGARESDATELLDRLEVD
jgi:hypothetical protein